MDYDDDLDYYFNVYYPEIDNDIDPSYEEDYLYWEGEYDAYEECSRDYDKREDLYDYCYQANPFYNAGYDAGHAACLADRY